MPWSSNGFVGGLDALQPTGAELVSELDNLLRELASAIQTSFPNVDGAVTLTHAQLNNAELQANKNANNGYCGLDGSGKIPAARFATGDRFASGTVMLFRQAAAPSGWVADTITDRAIRVTSVAGWTTGSTAGAPFSSVFVNHTTSDEDRTELITEGTAGPQTVAADNHGHTLDLRIDYVDVIMCTKS